MVKNAIFGGVILAVIVGFGVWALANTDSDDANNSTDQSQQSESADTNQSNNNQNQQEQPEQEFAEVIVSYTGDGFEPASIGPIEAGTAVKFVNNSTGDVWIASDEHPTHEELPEFDTNAQIGPGAEYIFNFTQAGTWTYHNHLNERETGQIVVE